jgi:putative DNA primase/helicase
MRNPAYYTESGRFQHDKFAAWFVKEANAVIIDDSLHVYKDGIYISGQDYIEAAMSIHAPETTRAQRAEVYSSLLNMKLNKQIPEINSSRYRDYIAFRNGLYNLNTNELEDYSQDIYLTNKIDWDYNPDATSEDVEGLINRVMCYDPELINLLGEVVGYCMFGTCCYNKAFVFIGSTHNGKSTFQDVLKQLFGDKNTSSLDMKDLTEKFKPAELVGKMVNLGDDISDSYIDDSANFKSFVSGKPTTVERKHGHPFTLRNRAKFVLSTNNMPRTKDRTGAVLSRLVIIPFNRTFSETDPDFDPEIGDRILNGSEKYTPDDHMSALINIGLAGLHRLRKQKKFSTSQKVEDAKKEYDDEINPIKVFIREYEEDGHRLSGSPRDVIYAEYTTWCSTGGQKPMSKQEFSKFVCTTYGMVVDSKYSKQLGKSTRTFVKI